MKGTAVGAGAGAAVGIGTWLVWGTIGVATGGTGVAIGLLGQVAIGAVIGAVAGTAATGGG